MHSLLQNPPLPSVSVNHRGGRLPPPAYVLQLFQGETAYFALFSADIFYACVSPRGVAAFAQRIVPKNLQMEVAFDLGDES